VNIRGCSPCLMPKPLNVVASENVGWKRFAFRPLQRSRIRGPSKSYDRSAARAPHAYRSEPRGAGSLGAEPPFGIAHRSIFPPVLSNRFQNSYPFPIADIVRDANPGYHLPVVYSNRLMSWTTVFLTAIVFRPLPTNEIYSSGSAGFSFASSMWFRRDLALFTPFTFSM
jgi:hypothetical protein